MSYQINKTDGTLLTEIVDSTIDQTATDLTLVGKNVSGYGEFLNENFIKLLENFAAESEPNNPIAGQLWFDTAENRLKVYDGNGFKIGSGPIVSGTTPLTLTQGDIWIDSVENQLYFYDGTDLQLAGPLYKDSQGISGHEVLSIQDTIGVSRTIVKMWVGSNLLGIYSSEVVPFTPAASILGFSGEIGPGFNQSTLSGQKFRVTATKADALVDSLGTLKTPDNFMKTDENTGTTGSVTITNATPLIMGPTQNNEIQIDPLLFVLQSNSLNQNMRFKVRVQQGIIDAITVITSSRKLGIFNDTPAYTLDVGGDARISGNLLVEGSTTTINTTNLIIEDHVIELAKNSDSSVSDNYADQGGIVLKGTTDHSILWNSSTTAWKSTESIDIASGKEYRINGVTVLSATQLGSSIVSAPGITSFGPQTQLTVDNLFLNNSRISSISNNTDIEIEPNGTGNVVLVGSPRITGLNDPAALTDAVNLQSMQDYVRARNICFSMDITGLSDNDIETQLSAIAPEADYDEGTEARIHCTSQVVGYNSITLTNSTSPVTTGDFVKHFISVDNSDNVGPQPTESVLQDFDINPISIGNANVTVTRTNKLFSITSGAWTFQGNF